MHGQSPASPEGGRYLSRVGGGVVALGQTGERHPWISFFSAPNRYRGWSLADCANQIDEGGAGGPAMPGGAAGNRAQTSRRKRLKELYALLYKHELDTDHRTRSR